MTLQVAAHIGIGVFVDSQGRRRVLDKQMQQPDVEFRQYGQLCLDLRGDQVKARRAWRQVQVLLMPVRGQD
jgi:hypothetical protein